jgi:uncharacterized phage infection (PIP) family protein YhgE
MEALQTSLKKLSESIALAGSGNDKYLGTFQRLGVSVRDSNGQIRDTHDVLNDVADAFAKAKDGPEKVAVAMQLMGKSGENAIPLLDKGAAAIAQLEAEASKLGKTISTETAVSASQFNHDLDKLTDSSAILARSLTGTAPAAAERHRESDDRRPKREAGLYGAAVAGLAEIFFQMSGSSDTMARPAREAERDIKLTRDNLDHAKNPRWFELGSEVLDVKAPYRRAR